MTEFPKPEIKQKLESFFNYQLVVRHYIQPSFVPETFYDHKKLKSLTVEKFVKFVMTLSLEKQSNEYKTVR